MNPVEQQLHAAETAFHNELEDFAFVNEFEATAKRCWKNAEDKGFHEDQRSFAEEIALMHSELSEALEYSRKVNVEDQKSDHIPQYSGMEEELADVIIRIMDTSKTRGFRIGGAIIAKMKFNSTRERKHGKLF